ncbi:MAG: hypothetical protein ABI859_20415 [Pseudomonadota bacterium]
MNDDNDLSEFEQRTRAALRASADDVDGRTRSRLTQARYAALEQGTRRPATRAWYRYAPAGAVAMAAVLATVLFIGRTGTPDAVNHEAGSAFYDVDLLADSDAYALSQESDFDFIEWAASMGEQAAAGT